MSLDHCQSLFRHYCFDLYSIYKKNKHDNYVLSLRIVCFVVMIAECNIKQIGANMFYCVKVFLGGRGGGTTFCIH